LLVKEKWARLLTPPAASDIVSSFVDGQVMATLQLFTWRYYAPAEEAFALA
jgi:hypothetical protein